MLRRPDKLTKSYGIGRARIAMFGIFQNEVGARPLFKGTGTMRSYGPSQAFQEFLNHIFLGTVVFFLFTGQIIIKVPLQ